MKTKNHLISERIINIILSYYNISSADVLFKKTQVHDIVRPRQMCLLLISKIAKLKRVHEEEIRKLKETEHPMFSEMKGLTNKQLDFFYENRWKPYKKINKVKPELEDIEVICEKISA